MAPNTINQVHGGTYSPHCNIYVRFLIITPQKNIIIKDLKEKVAQKQI